MSLPALWWQEKRNNFRMTTIQFNLVWEIFFEFPTVWNMQCKIKYVPSGHRPERMLYSIQNIWRFLSYFAQVSSIWDLAELLECLAVNAKVATVLGSIPASSDTVESEGQQMKQCWIPYLNKKKIPKSGLAHEKSLSLRTATVSHLWAFKDIAADCKGYKMKLYIWSS